MQKLTAAMDDKGAERLLDAVKLLAICDYLDGAGKPDDVNRRTAVLYFYESPFFRSRYSADEMIALCDKAAAKGIRGRDVKKRHVLRMPEAAGYLSQDKPETAPPCKRESRRREKEEAER